MFECKFNCRKIQKFKLLHNASRCNAPINVKPEGGEVRQGVGILTFSEKMSQILHPRDNIIDQKYKIPDPGAKEVVKYPSDLAALKRSAEVKLQQNQ